MGVSRLRSICLSSMLINNVSPCGGSFRLQCLSSYQTCLNVFPLNPPPPPRPHRKGMLSVGRVRRERFIFYGKTTRLRWLPNSTTSGDIQVLEAYPPASPASWRGNAGPTIYMGVGQPRSMTGLDEIEIYSAAENVRTTLPFLAFPLKAGHS